MKPCHYCHAPTPAHNRDSRGNVFCYGYHCPRSRELRGDKPEPKREPRAGNRPITGWRRA